MESNGAIEVKFPVKAITRVDAAFADDIDVTVLLTREQLEGVVDAAEDAAKELAAEEQAGGEDE